MKLTVKKWRLPKQKSSCAPDGVNTNVDNDVTPPERRTWNVYMIIGFWASDYLSMQTVENPSNSLLMGMTWKTGLSTSMVGMVLIGLPLIFNGAIGAALHVPFPVAVRSSFGYHFSKFAVITRCITAIFWHSIQTFSGSLAMTACITAIWPSFGRIPNKIPSSMGITSPQMIGHFVFWSVQFPFLLIPPHKLRWFFILKTIIASACLVGTAAGMAKMAGNSGDIWNQEYTVHGAERLWLYVKLLNSNVAGWATMATNIADFTRYMNDRSKAQYAQVVVLPAWATFVTMMSLVASSAGKMVYGSYIWSPTEFAEHWTATGSKGRAASFFVCAAWCISQIGTNLSANVITGANDLVSLFPEYINIRRGAVIITIISGWVLQAWKIENSAAQLVTFISGLSSFLAPITGIIIADYWVIKKQHLDVPALYDPNGRYSYYKGFNWRAALAFLAGNVPCLPGLASEVGSVSVNAGILELWYMSYFYGFLSSFAVYIVTNYFWPDRRSHVSETVHYIYEDEEVEEVDVVFEPKLKK
ncbi:hypothetical protein KL909_003439 [Ogataea angusta]|nr:hypothetical protein KL909_003439 [Ogataea angusta]KAG7837932.1 hypothetical protein KL943_000008 [Ogataea angusta]